MRVGTSLRLLHFQTVPAAVPPLRSLPADTAFEAHLHVGLPFRMRMQSSCNHQEVTVCTVTQRRIDALFGEPTTTTVSIPIYCIPDASAATFARGKA